MTVRPSLPDRLRGAVIALGNFDGVHKGHRAVVRHVLDVARLKGRPAIVAMFDPHPVRFFHPDAPPFLLTELSRRKRLLAALGVDATVILPFDHNMANLSPEAFVDHWLHEKLGASHVVVGTNFLFGKGRAGNAAALREIGARYNIHADGLSLFAEGARTASSTRIRDLLREGRVMAAAELLGRPHLLDGRITHCLDNRLFVKITEQLCPLPGYYLASITLSSGFKNEALVRVEETAENRLMVLLRQALLADDGHALRDGRIVIELRSDVQSRAAEQCRKLRPL